MNDGKQSEIWKERYLTFWAARQMLVEKWIEDGEKCPIRLINQLDRFEQTHMLGEVPVIVQDKVVGSRVAFFSRTAKTPEKLLPSGITATRIATCREIHSEIPAHTRSDSLQEIAGIFESSPNKFDAIIELGCGFGQNLFKLYYLGMPKAIHYIGGELAESGLALGRTLASLNSQINIELNHFDHVNPETAFIEKHAFENALIFTCHSLEQVKQVPQVFFDKIAACAKHVTCVHLEPFGFQLPSFSEAARRQRQWIESNDWNINLLEASKMAEDRGIIKRTFLARDIFFSNDEVSPTSLMVWKAVR